MSELRLLKILVFALLLLNLGTIGFLWMHDGRPHHPPPPPPERMEGRPESPAEYLRRNLNLSDAQESSYRTMREHHHETVMSIRERMNEQKRNLYRLMQQAESPGIKTQENTLLDSLASAQREIETITYSHFRDLRNICNSAQQQKFDLVIEEALERMH